MGILLKMGFFSIGQVIPPDCQDKLMQFGNNISGLSLVDLFKAVTNEAILNNLPASTLVITMYDDNSALHPGDYAAELHLVVRKVSDNDGNDTGDQV